jgi:membrane-anchored protein YejM (alkaline phosphatase superfamily)
MHGARFGTNFCILAIVIGSHVCSLKVSMRAINIMPLGCLQTSYRSHVLWRHNTAGYQGNIAFIDEWVGNIFTALEDTKQLENTWMIWTADHGDVRCAFSAEIYTRGCHWFPRLLA